MSNMLPRTRSASHRAHHDGAEQEPPARYTRPRLHISTSPTQLSDKSTTSTKPPRPLLETPQITKRGQMQHSAQHNKQRQNGGTGIHPSARVARSCMLSTLFRSTSQKSSASKSASSLMSPSLKSPLPRFRSSFHELQSKYVQTPTATANDVVLKRVRFETPTSGSEDDQVKDKVEQENMIECREEVVKEARLIPGNSVRTEERNNNHMWRKHMRRTQLFGKSCNNSSSNKNMNTDRLSPAMQRARKLSICTALPDDDSDDWNGDDVGTERDNILDSDIGRDNLLCSSSEEITPLHSGGFASFDSFKGGENMEHHINSRDGDADTDEGQVIGEGPCTPTYGVSDLFE